MHRSCKEAGGTPAIALWTPSVDPIKSSPAAAPSPTPTTKSSSPT